MTSAALGSGRFSRRTFMAAIEVLEQMKQADFSRMLRQFGAPFASKVRGEEASLSKRLNDLVDLVDDELDSRVDDGELLSEAVVERAAEYLKKRYPWSFEEQPSYAALRRALQMDGYDLTEGELRRSLPTDVGLPQVQDEVRHLLRQHAFGTAEGHLEQALEAHTAGNWSSANGQLRNFIDSVLDELAARIDPSAATLPTGQPRRSKLAAAGFLSRDLNEWSDEGRGFLNGLMYRLHPQGAHPGLSDDEDSTFRLHVVLLTARLLLVRYDQKTWMAGTSSPVP